MKYEFFIARRYLTRGRKNSFIAIISLVSIIGITIGVAALIIALSLINGFQSDIRNKILNSSAHLMITDRMGGGIENYQRLLGQIRSRIPDVQMATAVVYGTVLIRGRGHDVSGAIFRGVEIADAKNLSWLNRLYSGTLPQKDNDLLIGREMATKIGLYTGDDCMIFAPQLTLSPTGVLPRLKRFHICGVFKSGLFEFDNGTLISTLPSAQRLFNLVDKINYLQVNLRDMFQVDEAYDALRAMLPMELSVVTWRELNASLYSALRLEKTVLFFTLSLIIVVASLNIIAGLILMVMQKIKDIGILLSYGVKPPMIRRIFFIQGGVIGILGTGAGVAIGLAFCALANRFQLIKVPAEIYQVSFVPFHTTWFDLCAIVAVSLLISLTATIIPASKAAAVNVVEAVKYE